MSRTVLIDADIAAFQVATTQEEVYRFGDRAVLHADVSKGIDELNNLIEWIIETTDSDQAALFLTGTNNFRKEVYPAYKSNRTGTRKPMILPDLREHIMTLPRSFMEDNLEGDDLIGIHATKPHKGERVIYSADKDLKTIPGLHWCPEDGEVIEVTEEQADRFFFEQVITGDAVDGYPGCPGAGKAAAADLLDGGTMWSSYEHEFKSGPRKGHTETRWKKEPADNPWQSVVSAYRKVGLTQKDALIQARCARILRHGEYDFETKKVILWEPNLNT